jgi:hypothetical protein
MEPEYSLPRIQKPLSDLYNDPDESSHNTPSYFSKTQGRIAFFLASYMLHALRISSSI